MEIEIMRDFAIRCMALLFVVLPLTHQAHAQFGGRDSRTISSVNDVINKWSEDKRLFVKGNLGIGSQQLDSLEQWLAANAPHWTVVLMKNADGESYQTATGELYSGMDAVEYALGYGLNNRTNFGLLEHPATHERDGTVFVLFLEERKFSYFGSDAQDRRGLGEANWIGKLDQPAIRAMRSGGRIIDAVKDTITSVNAQLERIIADEVASAKRQEEELQRSIDLLKASIASSELTLEQIEKAVEEFRAIRPNATGPLMQPPVEKWRQRIAAMKASVSRDSVRKLTQELSVIDDEMSRYLNSVAVIDNMVERTKQIQAEALLLNDSPSSAAKSQVESITALLGQATKAAENAEANVDQLLQQAETELAAGKAELQKEQEAIARMESLKSTAERIATVLVGIASAAAIVVLAVLNQRRKPVMLKAKEELQLREASVAKETDNINVLFQRNDELLGSVERVEKRGYVGTTAELSRKALDYVDDLFIMSKEVRRVLAEAKELVYPTSFSTKIGSYFSSKPFHEAMSLVSGKPLRFTRANGLPIVLLDQLKAKGHATIPDEITMTYEEVFQAFQQRGVEAASALDILEESLTNVSSALSEMQDELAQSMREESSLNEAAKKDRYFHVPSYFELLIPAAKKEIESADERSLTDAVSVMQTEIPSARRKLDEAQAVAAILQRFRADDFPKLQSATEQLHELEYDTTWLDAALMKLSQDANELIGTAVERSIADETSQLDQSAIELKDRVARTLSLAQLVQGGLQKEVHTAELRISNERQSLANRLNLPQESVFQEAGRQPLAHIDSARRSIDAAKAVLHHGNVNVAETAVANVRSELQTANSIVDQSIAAVDHFDERFETIHRLLSALERRVPTIAADLISAERQFSDSSFTARMEKDGEAVGMPVQKLLDFATDPLPSQTSRMEEAKQLHRTGKLLQAVDFMSEITTTLNQSQYYADAVAEHLTAIGRQDQVNGDTLRGLQDDLRRLTTLAADARIMQRTLERVEKLKATFRQVETSMQNSGNQRDPFQVADQIGEIKSWIEELESQCTADRQAHAEASRAVAGARRQFESAQQLTVQSQRDGIPDSQTTRRSNQDVERSRQQLFAIEQLLQDAHGDWEAIDHRAVELQSELTTTSRMLSEELAQANAAASAFQTASRAVYQAEQWSGSYGIRITSSPGVNELERARNGLELGNYAAVLEISRLAESVATAAVQKAQREVQRRQMEEQMEREARRRRMSTPDINIFGNGGFGGGFGGGGRRSSGGGLFGGSSSSSGSGTRSSSSGGSSGFKRSGW